MGRCQRARAILAILTTLVTLTLCLVGARPATAFELTEGERTGILDALASVYMVRDDFELGDVDFERIEVGEPIPSYEAFDDGLVRSYDYYPLYFEGRMVALTLNRGDCVFQMMGATPAARALADAGCERAALIFDRSACYVWDGVRLQRLYGFVETVDDRADLSGGADPARFSDVEMAGLDDRTPVGFDLAHDLTSRSDEGEQDSAAAVESASVGTPVVLLACFAGVTLIALGLRSRRQV